MAVSPLSTATTSTPDLHFLWRFLPVAPLLREDGTQLDGDIGELYYANAFFDVGPALRIKDWVFVLTRLSAIGRARGLNIGVAQSHWVMAGFHADSHCVWATTWPDTQEARIGFFGVAVGQFWTMLTGEPAPDGVHFVPVSNTESRRRQAIAHCGGCGLGGGCRTAASGLWRQWPPVTSERGKEVKKL